MRDSQISLEALAEERSRYQRELDTFRNDINVRLLALQQERQGNETPATTGRGGNDRELRFKPQIGTFFGNPSSPERRGQLSAVEISGTGGPHGPL